MTEHSTPQAAPSGEKRSFVQRLTRISTTDVLRLVFLCVLAGFLLAALYEAGLVTLTHTPNPMRFLNEVCERPVDEKAYMLIVGGYPAVGATVPEHALIKKSLDEITSWL